MNELLLYLSNARNLFMRSSFIQRRQRRGRKEETGLVQFAFEQAGPEKNGDEEPHTQDSFVPDVFKSPADYCERLAVAPDEEKDQTDQSKVAQDGREGDEHEAHAALFNYEK